MYLHTVFHAIVVSTVGPSGAYLEGAEPAPIPLTSANIRPGMKVWNLVSWLSRKSLKLLPPDVRFLRLKCTKFNFGWGSAPDPAGGAYSVPSDPLAGLRGPTSKGRGGDGRGGPPKLLLKWRHWSIGLHCEQTAASRQYEELFCLIDSSKAVKCSDCEMMNFI